ncbi:hypothetical protein EVAR_71365_1 [Eumeta japonica]|uniref:Uncharacterized protein n=1 Tax=Eumeta variegata TaxID=151549 RepID=A0A4C2A5I3_EUMVA|nr:hypothetical protein EVAR_71365_1 [Eumeta japonica]
MRIRSGVVNSRSRLIWKLIRKCGPTYDHKSLRRRRRRAAGGGGRRAARPIAVSFSQGSLGDRESASR